MAGAVPLFNGLKHLPCPREAAGASCATSGCLFGHKTDSKPPNVRAVPSLDGASEHNDLTATESHSPPKKRQKTIDTGLELNLVAGSDEAGKSHLLTADSSSRPVAKAKASDLYDPLSPPVVGDIGDTDPRPAVTPTATEVASLSTNVPARPSPKPATPHRLSSSSASKATLASSSPSSVSASARKTASDSRMSKSPMSIGSSPASLAKSSSQAQPASSSTAARQAATKDQTALAPQESKIARKAESLNPRLLNPAPASHGSRHKLLTLMHAELKRLNGEVSRRGAKDPQLKSLLLSDQELIWMALDREQEIATDRAPIYPNLMRQEVMKYKKMKCDAWIAGRKQALEKKPAQKNSHLGPPVVINTGLTVDREIEVLKRLITPITNLAQHGYVPSPPTAEDIGKAREAVEMSRGWEQCDRCGGRFQVFPGRNITTGELASGGQCTYHPGRLYLPERQRGDAFISKKYRCCNQDVAESTGCATTGNHVFKTSDPKRLALLWNFAPTPPNDSPNVKPAVAFDCEMGYSVHGMELIRLTATSWPDGAELLDVLVQPLGEIMDLNSRYSGVFPEDLARAVPWTPDWTPPVQEPGERRILRKVASPEAARDLLFSFINPDTILIGHGLENDLNATRIVHPKIVDTILLYPHRRGLPIRTSLKVLMEMHLNRRIQIDTGEGHDSAEDARAAGDLVRLKVQKEWTLMQSNGWKFLDDVLWAPGRLPPPTVPSSEDSVNKEEAGALQNEEPLEARS